MAENSRGTDQFQSEQPASPCAKPLLTAEQQIAHLKAKGITFDLCPEIEAAEHLRTKCQFFRIYAYRKNFAKHIDGPLDGHYVALDFGQLRMLSNTDRMLRDILLVMTLDAEHFAKVRLLAAAEDHNEDGHAIMRDYLASIAERQRSHIKSELDRREDSPYSGDIVRKYRNDMPLWAFCEVVSFGAFLGVMKFCAERWGDKDLLRSHYCLRLIKSARNACAHGACILNDLSEKEERSWRTPDAVTRATANAGIGKRLRAKRLKSPRMAEMCTLLYLYGRIVPEGTVRSERKSSLAKLFRYFHKEGSSIPEENPVAASLAFLERLTRGLGLID